MAEAKTDKARKTIDLTIEQAEKVRVEAFNKRITVKELLEKMLTKEIAKIK